jgi:hypothetical protein
MERPAVLQWDKMIHESVRRDREPIVHMAAEVNKPIIMQASQLREYLKPNYTAKEVRRIKGLSRLFSRRTGHIECSNILTFSRMNWKGATS